MTTTPTLLQRALQDEAEYTPKAGTEAAALLALAEEQESRHLALYHAREAKRDALYAVFVAGCARLDAEHKEQRKGVCDWYADQRAALRPKRQSHRAANGGNAD